MAILAGPCLFTFLDLRGVTTNQQKLPIVCRRIESFLSLDHRRQEFRRARFSFKLFPDDRGPFGIDQRWTLRKSGAGEMIQVDRPKNGCVKIVLLFLLCLSLLLFTVITDDKNKLSTTGGSLLNGHGNWRHVGFTPGAVRRDHLQCCGFL